jgi:hypothetical protein
MKYEQRHIQISTYLIILIYSIAFQKIDVLNHRNTTNMYHILLFLLPMKVYNVWSLRS